MFYIEQGDKILQFEQTKEQLETLISFAPQYAGLEIKESPVDIVEFEGAFYFADDEEYLAKVAQKEAEHIAKLFLTGADVERGIYQAKGMDFDDIVAMVTQLQPAGLDIKALKIELKANNFYRGNPYVSAVGELLGFTCGQLNKFFETNDYTVLLPPEPVEPPVEDDLLVETEPESNTNETVLPEDPVEEVQDDNSTTDTTEPNISV